MSKSKRKPIPEFVTVNEICESLRVSRWTVYRMIQRGELDQKKFGNHIRITRESFDRYLANAGVEV